MAGVSAREMDRCECREGHTGPLMVLVAARCSGERGNNDPKGVICSCCGGIDRMPYAAPAGCWREQFWCDNCGAQALLVLEPLASFAGAES